MTDDLRKLLGGYATGTLTEEERALLYEAALEDPELFEALADEQAVRDLLDNSSARAELLAAVQDRPFSIRTALTDWFERPKSKVLAALAAVLLVSIGVKQTMESRQPPSRDVVAVLRTAPPSQSANPAPVQPQAQTPARAEVEPRSEAAKSTPAPKALSLPPVPPPIIAESPKPASAAVASTAADTAAAIETPVLSWSVLRVDSAGTATPVAQSYAFDAGDKARIRVEAKQSGMLLAKLGDEVLYAGTISPGLPVVLRRDIAFSGTDDAPAVDLEWAPAPVTTFASPAPPPPPPPAAAERRQARAVKPSAEAEQRAVPGGVVGGVIGGVPSGQSMGFRQAAPTLDTPQPQQRSRIRVQLQRKSP